MRATITDIQDETSDGLIRTYVFQPERKLYFLAGQFTELTLYDDPAVTHDDRGRMRQFTISSAPDQNTAAVTVNFRGSRSSFKHALRMMQPGDQFDISEAMGDFVLPLAAAAPMVWIAGGIGITPFQSIAQDLISQNQSVNAILFHSVSTAADAYQPFNKKMLKTIPRQIITWQTGNKGRITAADILAATDSSDETLFYISGPEPMVMDMTQHLARTGIPKERIITDAFLGYEASISD